jgi:methylenetetrahydrofolate reductase (NADPH)
VLCLTGDGVQAGDQPEAKPVFDLDSISLLRTARMLRDGGHFLSGRKLEVPPRFFLGAASNPFVPPYDYRPLRLAKKVEAGADFIQTQYCFDLPRFRQFMQGVRDLGLNERVFVLAGVGPLRSAKAAEWMRTRVPGVVIPDEIVARLKGVPADRQREEGKKICVELIQALQEINGVCGVHVMAYRQEELVAEIIEEAGLLPRRWQQHRIPTKEQEEYFE